MKYEFGPPNKGPYLLAVMVHNGAVENSHGGKTESRSMIVAYGQTNHPVIIVLPAPRFRDYVSQTYELDRIIW